jgi:HD-GYP domain-containing protein (c-di-GMP phosphodiesterase class II)
VADPDLQRVVERLEALNSVATALGSFSEADSVIRTVVENSLRVVDATRGSLMLVDEAANELYIRYAIGLPEQVVQTARVAVGAPISGWVASTGVPLLVKNIETDERFRRENHPAYRTGSLICAPVRLRNRVIGVLNVNSKADGAAFSSHDLDVVVALAGQASLALENVRLQEDLRTAYFATLRALIIAIEAKDPYTRGHSDRVTIYAIQIGERMGIDGARRQRLMQAAILHDIGKIAVDQSILHKPGRLTAEEFEVIKRHPTVADQILKPIAHLAEVRRLLVQHHERLDGKGYPAGLRGEQICLEGRILCVADSYDAMTSDRPYRTAMSQADAIAELRRCVGTQFDGDVVEAFCAANADGGRARIPTFVTQMRSTPR